MDEISVHVVLRKGRPFYLRYIDPVTGQRHEKASGTTSRRKAQKLAGEWQAELLASGAGTVQQITWQAFREQFTAGCVDNESDGYAKNIESTLNVVERLMKPDRLSRINHNWLVRLQTALRSQDLSPATIRKYFQHLRTMLNWAKSEGYIRQVPEMPRKTKQTRKGAKLKKGRAVTPEEFDRMLDAAPTESLRQLIEGLWLSGLRLSEALSLTWDQWSDGIRVEVDDDGDFLLRIDGASQKNREAQTYPVVDDFAEFLRRTPEPDRSGFVFNPQQNARGVSRRDDTVSRWITAIGKKARVKVDERKARNKETGKMEPVPVWASAHDLRRAFGTRWAKLLPSSILRELMRHSSIQTTMAFYVDIAAKDTIRTVRQHLRQAQAEKGDISGDIAVSEAGESDV